MKDGDGKTKYYNLRVIDIGLSLSLIHVKGKVYDTLQWNKWDLNDKESDHVTQ